MLATENSQIEGARKEWRKLPLSKRVEELRSPWCDANLLLILYGLKVDESWLGLWRSWARKQPISETTASNPRYHRYRLETFFQQQLLLPVELAALRLGMTAASLCRIIEALRDKGLLLREAYVDVAGKQLVDEALIRDFSAFFEELKFRTFGSYNSYCREIHRLVKQDLAVDIAEVKCITDLKVAKEDYANDRDILDLEPMGIAYQVWLDFGKPINLKPDSCSTLFYVENESFLKKFVFADVLPEIPEQLRQQVGK